MLLELSALWVVLLNVVGIPAIHLGLSALFLRLPADWFRPGFFPFREQRWECGGRTYERFLAVRSWKRFLPDGASWLGGFAKAGLRARDRAYLETFRTESCRGEAAHYAQVPGILLTLVWNPWPVAALVIVGYALLSNIPCIIVQRYTRLRLNRLLARG